MSYTTNNQNGSIRIESQVTEVELNKFIGIDFSMHDLYVTSEGELANYPRFLRRLERKLARLCRLENMRAMSRQLRFGKSVADNSFGKFREMLSYKLYFHGKKLIIVSKWFASSQLCSVCGYKNAQVKDLSIRSWKCPSCGAEHDRDINAAINLRDEGKRIAQTTTVGTTGSNAYGQ